MYKSIVVGTNGSATADIAVERAIALAKHDGRHAARGERLRAAPAHVGGSRPAAEAAELAITHFKVDAVLDRATDLAQGGGIAIEVHGPRGRGIGDPVRGRGDKADLIVLGSKGMQGARRVLGERAEQGVAPGALRRADRPDDLARL